MRSRKPVVIIVAVVALCLGIGTVAASVNAWGPFAPSTEKTEASDETSASAGPGAATEPPSPAPTTPAPTYGPDPTDVPSDPVTEAPVADAPEPAGGPATVVVTFAAWDDVAGGVEISAYAAVVEDAGTCTATLTRTGANPVAQTIDALTDARTMSCGGFLVPGSQLSSGTWEVVVSYSSSKSSGESTAVEVDVP